VTARHAIHHIPVCPFSQRVEILLALKGRRGDVDFHDPACARVRRWRDACLAHPAAQQVTKEELVMVYYDYAKGAGNGALLPGRTRSSFVLDPGWRDRPWPPRDKYGRSASDAELGLLPNP
jgi:glutathione S-transferase